MASPSPAAQWVAHFSQDGRPFWNHTITKESVWLKPSELKTAVELEFEKTPWKEYETGGRKYWVNAEGGETTWDMPLVLKQILANAAPQAPSQPTPTLPTRPMVQDAPTGLTAQSGALVAAGGYYPSNAARPSGSSPFVLPDYTSHDNAEKAFINMLHEIGVTPEWTWERTMRESITSPYYKVLKTLSERKTAFEKCVKAMIEEEKSLTEASLARSRKDWNKALEKLGGGPEREEGVKSWWKWESSGKRELEKRLPEDLWEGLRNDGERKTLFEDFVTNLKTKELAHSRAVRAKNIAQITELVLSLSLDLAGPVRWREVQATIFRTPEWQHDESLQRMDMADVLQVFEEQVRKKEIEGDAARVKAAEEKRRRGRRAREDFTALLGSLLAAGHLTASSTWKSTYPLIGPTSAYQNLLGHPGSTPIELFWDVVDELERKLDEDCEALERLWAQREGAAAVVEDAGVEGGEEAFVEWSEGKGGREWDYEVVKKVFDKIQAKAARIAKEERRKKEKELRLQIDDLRYAYKKLDPSVGLDDTYEMVLPRIQDSPEFLALADDEARRTAFDKFIKRQKEKAKDREREIAEDRERELARHASPARRSEREDDSRSRRDSSARPASRRDRSSRAKSEEEDAMMDYGTAGDDAKGRRAGVVKREAEGELAGTPVRKTRRKESEKGEEGQVGAEAGINPKLEVEEGEIA